MDSYNILKLNNDPFDFLVIATSCDNPLSHFDKISNDLQVEKAKILFDLTLINGLKSNRYITCDYHSRENNFSSCSLLPKIDEKIKSITSDYFSNNQDIVQNSILPNSLKFLLKSGLV